MSPTRPSFTKPLITFPAQLLKLEARGLTVADPARSLRYLNSISYYRLAGYWPPYLDGATGQFRPGTTFEQLIQLYRFDKKLRILCLEAIERLEIAFRTQLVYHVTQHTGTNNWYEQPRFFKRATPAQQRELTFLQRTIASELGRAGQKTFLAAYSRKYAHPRNPPAWMALEVLSFGTLYKLFELLADAPLKFAIANHFNLTLTVFESWMRSLNTIRNKCAHHDRFWDAAMQPMATNQGDRTGYWLKQPSASTSTTRVYYALSMLNFLMVQVSGSSSFCGKVRHLMNAHSILADGAHLAHMGFPADWERELMWVQV